MTTEQIFKEIKIELDDLNTNELSRLNGAFTKMAIEAEEAGIYTIAQSLIQLVNIKYAELEEQSKYKHL